MFVRGTEVVGKVGLERSKLQKKKQLNNGWKPETQKCIVNSVTNVSIVSILREIVHSGAAW